MYVFLHASALVYSAVLLIGRHLCARSGSCICVCVWFWCYYTAHLIKPPVCIYVIQQACKHVMFALGTAEASACS